jgi:small GTP-binding protein
MSYDRLNISPIYKIILIGSSSVGKTSLCNTIQGRLFDERTPITIGVDFSALVLKDDINEETKSFKVHLWDTAGHETFRSIAKSYYRNSQIILLCFDLTNRASFAALDTWMDEINSIIDKHVYICLVGLKSELEPVVSKNEIDLFLEKYLILSYKSYSTKYDNNAKEIKKILYELIHKYDLLMEDYERFKKNDQKSTILIDNKNNYNDKTNIKDNKKKCCMTM